MSQSKTDRLKEYGMYIRRTNDGTYNLGWTFSQRRGGIANFPTYDDAYNAFEEIIDRFWEYKSEDLMQLAESMILEGNRPRLGRQA